MAHPMFQKSSNHFYVFLQYYFIQKLQFVPFFLVFILPLGSFVNGFFVFLFFYIVTRLTVRGYKPIYLNIYVFHNLLMLMFNVLVNSIILAKVKASTITFDLKKKKYHPFLIHNLSSNQD